MGKMKGASLEQAIPGPSKAEQDYETEDNMRTMHNAAAIAADPAKLKKVHKLAGRRHKALTGMLEPLMAQQKKPKKISSIDDLKAARNEVSSQDNDDDDMGN